MLWSVIAQISIVSYLPTNSFLGPVKLLMTCTYISILTANEASRIVVNARVVTFGKVQTDKDGISHCESEYLTFPCVIYNLLQNFVEKLQQEYY